MSLRKAGYNWCASCGGRLQRVHRDLRQRVFFMARFRCEDCAKEISVPRPFTFLLGREGRCISCGTYRVVRLVKKDQVDRLSYHPYSIWHGMLGAKLSYCTFCRLQFHDGRNPLPRSEAMKKTASDA